MERSTIASRGRHDLTALAEALAGTFPAARDSALTVALVRELARGKPVAARALAAMTGRDLTGVVATLAGWPNVERDAHGRVIAFSGLTLRPTAHRLDVGGQELHAWCAWDTLFLPTIIGGRASVHSHCPLTDTPVRLSVDHDGVRAAEPKAIGVSFPAPDATRCEDIRATFCCQVRFLAGPRAADRWLADHDGALVLSLDDAFELGRLATRTCLTAD